MVRISLDLFRAASREAHTAEPANSLCSWNPNAITIFGNVQFLALGLYVWSVGGTSTCASPLWLALAVSCVVRVYADWLDGMHARATGQTSVVGSFLDHAMDVVSIPLTLYLLFLCLGIQPADPICLLAVVATSCGLFASLWTSFLSGVLYPDEMAELLFGWASPVAFFCASLLGSGFLGNAGFYVGALIAASGTVNILSMVVQASTIEVRAGVKRMYAYLSPFSHCFARLIPLQSRPCHSSYLLRAHIKKTNMSAIQHR